LNECSGKRDYHDRRSSNQQWTGKINRADAVDLWVTCDVRQEDDGVGSRNVVFLSASQLDPGGHAVGREPGPEAFCS
jgi:hypothetical protein